jgi:hypothetical protein
MVCCSGWTWSCSVLVAMAGSFDSGRTRRSDLSLGSARGGLD